MTSSLSTSDARAYKRRARVITAYGLISFMVGVAGLIDRSLLTTSSAVQTLSGPVSIAWLATYALGGALAAGGVMLLRPDLEAAGDVLLLAFALLNATAILLNRGPVGGGVTATSLVLVAYVLHGRIGDLHQVARFERRRPGTAHAFSPDVPDRRHP
jgi:hypothetical protein